MPPRLVLASGSPRRRDLLAEAGLSFEVVVPRAAEILDRSLTIRELTICNATRKALEVARRRREAVVLGADTLVALDGEPIGKPGTLAAARRMLRRLNGREHEVCTAVFIRSPGGEATSFRVVSRVQFRTLTAQEIADYLSRINPLDKAGAYAAQAGGEEIIQRIYGSFTNVVGLPMGETLRALRQLGLHPARVRRRKLS